MRLVRGDSVSSIYILGSSPRRVVAVVFSRRSEIPHSRSPSGDVGDKGGRAHDINMAAKLQVTGGIPYGVIKSRSLGSKRVPALMGLSSPIMEWESVGYLAALLRRWIEEKGMFGSDGHLVPRPVVRHPSNGNLCFRDAIVCFWSF